MKYIIFYNPDYERTISKIVELSFEKVEEAGSMKGRITLKDGSIKCGYIETAEDKRLALQTFKEINEDTHEIVDDERIYEEIQYDDIQLVEVILFSGLRWDAPPSNRFK